MLSALILAAAVANLNLSVANVALPTIGHDLDASQSALNLVAVAYSLGLAGSVLYLGALGDRHGRKGILLVGMLVSIPACLAAAFAPSIEVLMVARVVGGVAAGAAYPTTLALITALWSGAKRTRAIALWSGLGGAISALGPLSAGWMLEVAWWGAVFLMTLPLAVVAIVIVIVVVPARVEESAEPVDNLGGVLSIAMVVPLVLAISLAATPGASGIALILGVVGIAAAVLFVLRQRRARTPLYDLRIAGRRTFWVAAVAGILVFGSLMGAMYIGQLYLQNVLGYTGLQAGLAVLPAAALLVVGAPLSASIVSKRGSRTAMLIGISLCLLGFISMLLLWNLTTGYAMVCLSYALIGLGVGVAGPPASHSLTDAVPVHRAGMASGTADLQRDLGGALMQSILGALLTASYAGAIARHVSDAPAGVRAEVTNDIQAQLQKSFDGALVIAQRYPDHADAIMRAARESFLSGADWAYLCGIITMVVGFALVFVLYPRRARELDLVASYAKGTVD
ncbi:MFS transporter [Okibacterium endophyticum]